MRKTTGMLLLFLFLALSRFSAGEELSASGIAEKAYSRYDGEDGTFRIEMVLIDRAGSERKRLMEVRTKDYGELTKSYLRFIEPADIENTSFLTREEEAGDDTQYLYLPELGRARRIVSSQKNLRFVNTDFTYEDMQRRKPDSDVHARLTDDECLGRPCYVLESVPVKGSSQYSKRVSWIDKESFVVLKTFFHDRKAKKSKEFTVKKLEKIQDIWTPVETMMEDFKEEHRTAMNILEVKYNQGLKDEIFTLRYLEGN